MLPLRDLQQQFKQSLLHQQETALDCIDSNTLDASRRMQIYRNNYFTSLRDALLAVYPVINKLVGEEFFSALAKSFIMEHPSTDGNLCAFGDKFALFLKTFSPVKSLPYLYDVAQLEWAYHRAFHGDDCTNFNFKKLASVPESEYSNIVFLLNPTSQLFAFEFPVLRIWEMCQQNVEDAQEIDLNQGGEYVLVIRRQWDITFEKLSIGEFTLLSECQKGISFGDACLLAIAVNPAFNVNTCLQKHLLKGTIVDCTLQR